MNDYVEIHKAITGDPKPKPFVIYIPQQNQIYEVPNTYGMSFEVALSVMKFGLKKRYTIVFLGEL